MAISKLLYINDGGKRHHGVHLKNAIAYVTALEKTQDGRWIGGINCLPEYAYEQMKETKACFGKIDKRQAYHLIISFAEGEMDADRAFSFTEEFAKEYLGNRYEAIYTVHDNTDHMHSHIIFNSVSFLDGLKFHYKKGDWEKDMQPILTRLCKEYGVSVFEPEQGILQDEQKGKDWDVYKNGPFHWSEMVARDMDIAIVQAESFEEFLASMKEKGYEIKQNKYLAVKAPGMRRFLRTKTLGKNYEEERIRERIPLEHLSNYKMDSLEEAERVVYTQIPYGKRAHLSKLQKKYYAKLYRLGLIKQKPYSQAWRYRKEIREMQKVQNQYLFLVENQIESLEDLLLKTDALTEKRQEVRAEKRRIYQARQRCEGLFHLQDTIQKYQGFEESYQMGDAFFQEEHERWEALHEELRTQGYSYEEVEKLREHFQSEYARIGMLEKEVAKKLRVAKSILQELQTEEEPQKEKETEKNREKEQPKR